jgi:hypothetical protein
MLKAMKLSGAGSILAFLWAAALSLAQAQTYLIFAVPGAVNGTFVSGINDNGDTTGYWSDAATDHGFVRTSAGVITTFDAPNSTRTSAFSINVAGAITGNYFDLQTLGTRGFVRNPQGAITSFDVPGGSDITPMSINSGGQIAGYYSDPSGYQGFERAVDGSITTFAMATGIRAFAINDSGFIIGQAGTNAFIRDPAGAISVAKPVAAGVSTFPVAINNSGTIAGYLAGPKGTSGFTRAPHESVRFFELNGASGTEVRSINNSNSATGTYFEALTGYESFMRTADGTVTPIICPGSEETFAFAINASGVIAGNGTSGANSNTVGFIFTP